MKWWYPGCHKILSVLCLLTLGALSVSVYASDSRAEEPNAAEPVRIVSGPHYPPFAADYLPDNGLGPFLVARVFEAGGKAVTSHFRPWKRAYRETLQSKYDAILPYTETPERKRDFLFSKPVFRVHGFVYVRSDSPINAESLEELKGYTYCNPLGFADGRAVAQMEVEGHITRLSPASLENCFKMLVAGRVDFIKTNPHVAHYMANQHDLSTDDIRALTFIVETETLHVMIPRTHANGKALIQAFNQALTRMEETGQTRELRQDYLQRVRAGGTLPPSYLE